MLRNAGVVAGAAVATGILVGVTLFAVLGRPGPATSPGPGASTEGGSAGPTTPGTSGGGLVDLGAPTEVSGLPVRSIADALVLRDAGSGARIAILGWAIRYFVPCPMQPDAFQPLEDCVYGFTWLMAEPEQLVASRPDGTFTIHGPVGPGFNTTFDPPDPGVPQAVVLIGHFHDANAGRCPAGPRRDACENLFVVDGSAWLGPIASAVPGVTPVPGPSG